MTTDTVKKEIAVEFDLGGKTCRIGAIAKGSGMINPNMATLLCFITTDVAIEQNALKTALKFEIGKTLNYVSIDGDTSTNDMAVILANGLAENDIITENDGNYSVFISALDLVLGKLAQLIAKDGEGATKLVRVLVTSAPTKEIAQNIAQSVINSPLVKSALSAGDANWGRILCAIGNAKGDFDVSNIEVFFSSDAGTVKVCEKSAGVYFNEDEAHKILSSEEVNINIYMNNQNSERVSGVALGCDLTADYVRINSEYRT
jgi:glutamate N-acetyltransferase/amino-acid N-acetyltransferase